MKLSWTFFIALLTLIVTSFSALFTYKSTQESLKLTRESLKITNESLIATKNSLEVNKETLKEAIESGSWSKMGKIYSTTIYNCSLVMKDSLTLKDDKLMPTSFIIEPYIDDIFFINEKFGNEVAMIIGDNLNDMFLANHYIDTLKELNVIAGAEVDLQKLDKITEQTKRHNVWIDQHRQNIKNNFCNIILEKFSKLLLEYKNHGTVSVEN